MKCINELREGKRTWEDEKFLLGSLKDESYRDQFGQKRTAKKNS